MSDNRAIAVFDSGLGGLTVLGAIRRLLPQESTLYLGDTARVPYGVKSPQTVVRYSINNAKKLLSLGSIKMLVVACGTATSHALPSLKNTLKIPVLGTVEGGARGGIAVPDPKSIAILATNGTVLSGSYKKELRDLGFQGEIQQRACPLFAPLVEEGLIDGPIASMIAKQYLDGLSCDVDTVILGCTHYPILAPLLKEMMPSNVRWVDSSEETAKSVERYLRNKDMLSDGDLPTKHNYYVTDCSGRLEELSELFLGEKVEKGQVNVIDV